MKNISFLQVLKYICIITGVLALYSLTKYIIVSIEQNAMAILTWALIIAVSFGLGWIVGRFGLKSKKQ